MIVNIKTKYIKIKVQNTDKHLLTCQYFCFTYQSKVHFKVRVITMLHSVNNWVYLDINLANTCMVIVICGHHSKPYNGTLSMVSRFLSTIEHYSFQTLSKVICSETMLSFNIFNCLFLVFISKHIIIYLGQNHFNIDYFPFFKEFFFKDAFPSQKTNLI